MFAQKFQGNSNIYLHPKHQKIVSMLAVLPSLPKTIICDPQFFHNKSFSTLVATKSCSTYLTRSAVPEF